MNRLQKAKSQLKSIDVSCAIETDCLYVVIGDIWLELSDFEVSYRAAMYDNEISADQHDTEDAF